MGKATCPNNKPVNDAYARQREYGGNVLSCNSSGTGCVTTHSKDE